MRNDLSGLIINIIANFIFQTVSAVKTTRSGEEDNNVTDYNHVTEIFWICLSSNSQNSIVSFQDK